MSVHRHADNEDLSITARSRDGYIDTLRGIAILGVVCIHFGGSFATTANAWTPSFFLGLFLNQISHFAVPLFIFISGWLAGFSDEQHQYSVLGYYRKRVLQIGIPYFVASVAAFAFLGYYETWVLLPSHTERLRKLLSDFLYFGIHPVFYFIPLIIQLYILQPVLKSAPNWVHRIVCKKQESVRFPIRRETFVIAILFLILHIVLAILCYNNKLNYYTWARANPLFWLFYFYMGLHCRALLSLLPIKWLPSFAGASFVVALVAMAFNAYLLTDISIVGEHFELSKLDYVYVRPGIILYNLSIVSGFAIGIALGWSWRAEVFELFGKSSLAIYLWHIIFLYEIAWRHPTVLEQCRQIPELLFIISVAACTIIALSSNCLAQSIINARQYRIVIVKVHPEYVNENESRV